MAFGASEDTVESLRAELHQAWSERSRFESLWHSEQEHTVRRGDEARSLRRELEATRAELAAAHAELAGLRGGVVRSGDCGGVVCVNTADVSGLGDGALLDRVVCLGEARNSIEGLYTEAVGEMVRRNCRQGAAWSLREYLRVSASQARSDATWSNLALGKARNAGEAQKLVLALRDGGCIGCDAPSEQTHAHHIQNWSNGGPTNISNLASVCPSCHKLIHDHNWQIHIPPNGKPQLTAPHHLQHPKCTPTTPEPENRPTTTTPAAAPAHTNPILTT